MENDIECEIPTKAADVTILDENDVTGKNVYGFSMAKKRGAMTLAAVNTPQKLNKIKQSVTPSKNIEAKEKALRTPARIRKCVKSRISRILEEERSDAEITSDESDSAANEDNSEDSSDESSEASSDDVSPSKIPNIAIISKDAKSRENHVTNEKSPFIENQCQIKNAYPKEAFMPKSDDFFRSHFGGGKVNTSEHTLDLLKTSRLPINKVFTLLSQLKVSSEHERSIENTLEHYKSYFLRWLYIMNEGYNLLLYGLGSKRQLLQTFHKEVLNNYPVIVINGFFPSLTVKQILENILNNILDITRTSENSNELVDLIEKEFSMIPSTHLFLIFHNIDGSILRTTSAQTILSRLAKVNNIHLIATVDHINAPLLWDHIKLSNFNFSWWDCTTLLPYTDETAFEDSLLVQSSSGFALSSLRSVFSSLTSNAKGIYLLIIKYQLKHKSDTHYAGMSFKDLYWSCREKFLVSSDIALRAQLTEFLDHKLIKSKRSVDGSEQLIIPIDSVLLKEFIDEQEK